MAKYEGLIRFYNFKDLKAVVEEITGLPVSISSLRRHINRGYILPTGIVRFGKNEMHLYTEKDVYDYYDRFDELKKSNKFKKRRAK